MNFIFKHKHLFSILGGLIVFSLGFLSCKDCVVFQFISEFILSIIFTVLLIKTISFWELNCIREKEIQAEIQREKEKVLKSYNSYINQLSNIIAGINHEVAPWLGGIQNKITRLIDKSNKQIKKKPSGSDTFSLSNPEYVVKKLKDIESAADTAIQILKNRSKDVKKLQRYSTSKSVVIDTLQTWVSMAMVDRSVKCNISQENIYLHRETLIFEANHSPLLLSQIILNLVKNSVEHNEHMLESLLITITGDEKRNCIIYEDNGKGIPDDKVDTIFEPGITSKKHEKEIHGLGLSLCVDYCECMDAAITAEKSKTGAKFVIYFDYDYDRNIANIHNVDKRIKEV